MRKDTQTQLGGEWEDAALRLAATRVVWNLDHVEAPGAHQVAEIVEAARVVVGRLGCNNLRLPFQLLEQNGVAPAS
ncbi:MAG TPA: hypothetical protein VHK65_15710 [Candidatus Dormibacteraeota bacterium]|nr:hypothetical protein [Candidatus Dormibacteraeota bacterium]